MKKSFSILLLLLVFPLLSPAQSKKVFETRSPSGTVVLKVEAGDRLSWSVLHRDQEIIAPSVISMTLEDGTVFGEKVKISSSSRETVDTSFMAINYRKAAIRNHYTRLVLNCKGGYGLVFRVYDNAVAYRFFSRLPGEIKVMGEQTNFNFTGDQQAFIPIQWDYRDGQNFNSSFEALYHEIRLSQFPDDSLAFLPLLVDAGMGKKVEIFEADLEDYPGMYLDLNETGKGLKGVFAPYPLETYIKSRNVIPSKRAAYIAATKGTRNFPWRAVFISEEDRELLDIDLVQQLASPPRISDYSWVKPGLVSWDWWNALNISHVDFKSGMNTPTYRYYIDFAAKYGLSYIILDEGWNIPGDLTALKPEINLDELLAYGAEKGVGIILWCSWKDVMAQMDKAFPFFAMKGVKGLKIDFVDRDDQVAVASTYAIAAKAAEHKLMVDYHGISKPTGLQRTYPNVVGYEGVRGLENFKWADEDQPRYCVTIPFIRNQAGPMDYTPGSMRNVNESNFRPVFEMPMSKGTRVNQMAQYLVFDVSLQMLADNPTIYMKEHECTSFIAALPTTFDELLPLDGQVAEYVALAKKKGDTWYVAAMTNWTGRELTLDFSFLGDGVYRAEIFSDGVNANRDATDYRREVHEISRGEKITIRMMNGGGWVARLEKVR
ncbi:MAG: glycoside hydrolase family 97 protein [Bacteroidota bacterium]